MSNSHSPSGYRIKDTGLQLQNHPKKSIGFFKKLFEPKKPPENEARALTLTPHLSDDLTQRIKTAHELVESAKAELSKKTAEFEQTNLENSILAIQSQIEILQSEIENPEDKLLSGELKTEGLLRIRAEIQAHEKNIADLVAVQDLQHNALVIMQNSLNKAEREAYQAKEAVQNSFITMLADDFMEKSKEDFDDLLKAILNAVVIYYHNDFQDHHFSELIGEVISKAYRKANQGNRPNQKESRAFVEGAIDSLINNVITGD